MCRRKKEVKNRKGSEGRMDESVDLTQSEVVPRSRIRLGHALYS